MEKQPATTIQNQVYQYLREEICSGHFAPGQKLQEQALATVCQVSRSPVREALRRLGADGLVEEIPNRGVFVRVLMPKDIEEIYEVRVMLESKAIDRLTPGIMAGAAEEFRRVLEQLRTAFAAGDLPTYTRLDTQLHRLLVSSCGNRLIFDLYDRIDCHIRQFRRYSLLEQKRFADSVTEHERIIRLVLEGNTAAAKEENLRHLLLARDQILDYMAKNPS